MGDQRTIYLGEIPLTVFRKNIKNVNLSVHPPAGNVRISAPRRMKMEAIRVFALSKLGWIEKQQRRIRAQHREAPRKYVNQEVHYLWGQRYPLEIVEKNATPHLNFSHDQMLLQVRPGSDALEKQAIMEKAYRQQLKDAIPPLIAKWEPRMGVNVADFKIRKMKTKWGSCTPTLRTIRFSLELAKKPPECLEYVVVHEMVHLLEASHNSRFKAFMDQFMPQWKFHKEMLNRLPISG
ncbi:MAG: SprT family zinc-dependent metalloprotease [Cyanobacteria bacterium P01_A01_bin.17]